MSTTSPEFTGSVPVWYERCLVPVALCQFGVMLFPDKLAGMKSVRRVLAPSGTFVFSVMDAFERNPFGRIANAVIGSFIEPEGPRFYLTPFGYADTAVLERAVREAGFRAVRIEKLAKELRAESIRDFATGLVRGNPCIAALAERNVDPEPVIEAMTARLQEAYGDHPFRGPIQAIVVTAEA